MKTATAQILLDAELVGQIADLTINGTFKVKVCIIDVSQSYGVKRCKIVPVAGSGTKNVLLSSLSNIRKL